MATFRELVAGVLTDSELGSENALPAAGTSDLVGAATGFEKKAARFTNEAWNQIQQDQENWLWMQDEFTAELRDGVARYDPRAAGTEPNALLAPNGQLAVGDNGFRSWHTENRWYITDTVSSTITGGEFPEISFQRWRGRQQQSIADQRPTYYAIHPMLDLLVTPTPNQAYRITGEYQIGVQSLVDADDEVRALPEQYTDLIKWKAILMLHADDEAVASVEFAQSQYAIHFNNLKRQYLPKTTLTPAIGADGYDDYRAATVQEFFSR